MSTRLWAALFSIMSLITISAHGDPASRFRISVVLESKSPDTESFKASESADASMIHVSRAAIIERSDVERFLPQPNAEGEWHVIVTLTKSGTKKFREATQRLVGKQLAIILDGKLMNAPILRAPIEDGHIVLAGHFDEDWLIKMTSYFESSNK